MNKNIDFYIDERIVEAFYNTDKKYIVTYGGRGSGKTLQFAAISVLYMTQHPNSRILAIRGVQNKISESSLQTMKDVVSMLGLDDYFIITENTLKCKNGSEALFYGAKNYHSFKSLRRIDVCFVDEATELSEAAWDTLIPTIREDNSRFLISFNPEKKEDWVWKQFVENSHPDAVVIEMNYYDNPYFPDILRREMELDEERNIAKYNHIWLGELREEVEGALWNYDMINHLDETEEAKILLSDYAAFEKIVVALDPSGTSKATSDACGLVVVGKYVGTDRWCVLEDATKIMSPAEWASRAVALYNKYQANKILYESNYGGDMVKQTIKSVDKFVPIEEVRATKGKILRAEPIAALYEQGKVDHLRKFPDLEYEMTTYNGDPKQKSPNRLDALVWGLTWMLKKRNIGKMSVPNLKIRSIAL